MWNIRVEQLEKIYYKFPLRPGDTCLVSWLSPGVAENLDSLPELLWQNINSLSSSGMVATARALVALMQSGIYTVAAKQCVRILPFP